MLEWNNYLSQDWTGVASFIDKNENVHWSGRINVDEGDRIKGELNWQNSVWEVCIRNLDTGGNRCLGYSDVDDNDIYIFTALEVYNVYNYKDVPGHTTFHDMSFIDDDGNPYDIEWEPYIDPAAQQILPCLDVDVVSDSEVKLFTPVCGDVDGDGGSTPTWGDGQAIILGNISTCKWAADVDCDNSITWTDFQTIVLGAVSCCDPGCPA